MKVKKNSEYEMTIGFSGEYGELLYNVLRDAAHNCPDRADVAAFFNEAADSIGHVVMGYEYMSPEARHDERCRRDRYG